MPIEFLCDDLHIASLKNFHKEPIDGLTVIDHVLRYSIDFCA